MISLSKYPHLNVASICCTVCLRTICNFWPLASVFAAKWKPNNWSCWFCGLIDTRSRRLVLSAKLQMQPATDNCFQCFGQQLPGASFCSRRLLNGPQRSTSNLFQLSETHTISWIQPNTAPSCQSVGVLMHPSGLVWHSWVWEYAAYA